MIKFILIKFNFSNTPYILSGIQSALHPQANSVYWGNLIGYIIFTPIQECIARGSLQSSFYHFLTGSIQKRLWYAIIVSNFLFSLTHLHLAYTFAYAVLLRGIF
ncbi:CPBP family glutamic-type intramembrane protease [Coxiella endosymbiont of Ornithodoros maritimus]|uniref:CPBP family glutamic-type intramembrane protease n=1 Tax=Coxiella endosymbiont of Ornithodoros maritimus TaxID=1656172 RepID=UPI003898E5D7